MARNPYWLLISWALSLSCLLSCREAITQDVTLVGCDEVRRGPICLLAAGKSAIQLVVDTTPGSELTIETASHSIRLTCDDAQAPTGSCIAQAGGSVLRFAVPSNHERLRLINKAPGLSLSRKYEIAIEPTEPILAWITAATTLRIDRVNPRPHEAELLVRQHLAPDAKPELSPIERAQAQSELARSLQEQLRLAEAEVAFKEAIRLDELAGLYSNKANDLVVLFDTLFDQRKLSAIEQLLSDNQDLFNLMGRWRPWPALYRAQNAYTLGDLNQAQHYLDQVDQINKLCGDERSINVATWWRSGVRAALGLEREDGAMKEAAKGFAAYSCRLGLVLCRQADLRLQLLSSELGEGVEPDVHTLERLAELWKRWETLAVPEPAALLAAHGQKLQALLAQSLTIFKQKCPIPRHIGTALLSQAQLELLMGNPVGARDQLAELRRLLAAAHVEPEQLPLFSLDWTRLSARLARAEGRFADAVDQLSRFRYTGDDVNAFEVKWSLLFGRAFALYKQGPAHRDEALLALRTANALIEDASHSAPLLLSRGPLLGRFEWGSRLLLEVLLRIDDQGQSQASPAEQFEALALMRHLRTRPLLGLRRLELVQRLDDSRRHQWTTAVSDYLAARRDHEEALEDNQSKKKVEELQAQVHKRLAEALAILGEAEPPPPRPPASDEVFLICHPLYTRWACIAGNDRQVLVSTLSSAELRTPAVGESGTSALLKPFVSLLERARVVSVLGYGDFRSVKVDLLPLSGQPLGNQRDVRYALDIGTSEEPAQTRQAVIALDAKLEYADDPPLNLGTPLTAAIQKGAAWHPRLMNLGMHGTVGSAVEGAKPALREELASAGLVLLFGHMEYAPGSGWINGIHWTQWSHLTGGDIMISAGRVPARVILIACSSGATEDVIGGHEALGLAQAFLLRGSHEVLATTRPVTAEAGKLIATKVLERLAAQPEETLARALRALTAELAGANPNGSIERNHGDESIERRLFERVYPQLDAFRVITP